MPRKASTKKVAAKAPKGGRKATAPKGRGGKRAAASTSKSA